MYIMYIMYCTTEKCSMPSLTGPCRGNFKRWFYEAATKTCKEFTYGGCQGNDNRFNTREECEGECKGETGFECCYFI